MKKKIVAAIAVIVMIVALGMVGIWGDAYAQAVGGAGGIPPALSIDSLILSQFAVINSASAPTLTATPQLLLNPYSGDPSQNVFLAFGTPKLAASTRIGIDASSGSNFSDFGIMDSAGDLFFNCNSSPSTGNFPTDSGGTCVYGNNSYNAPALITMPNNTNKTSIEVDNAGGGVMLSLNNDGTANFVGVIDTPTTFGTLPACSATTEGRQASLKDSTTNTWGATITGLGADHVLAYCDGTNWTVAGK